ncbi:hypothetical protein DXG01_004483 [Tephrocybe rancida]|nr:hypothetical protein DXG01_004483 [Tephrocybe rancida]
MLLSLSLSASTFCFFVGSVDPGPLPPTSSTLTVWSSSFHATISARAYCLSYPHGGLADAVKMQLAPAAVATASPIPPVNRSSGVNATVMVPSLVPVVSSFPAQNKKAFSTSLSALPPYNTTVMAPIVLTTPAKLVDNTPSTPHSIYSADPKTVSPDMLTTPPRQATQVNRTAIALALANTQATPLEWVSGPEWTWISAYLAVVFHFDSPHHLYTRRWPLPGRLIATATIGRMAGYTVWKMGEGYCSAVLYRHRRKMAARRMACLQQAMETGSVWPSTVPPSRIPATPTTPSDIQEAFILPTKDTNPPEPTPAAFIYGTCPLDAMPSEWYAENFKSKAWAVQTAFIGTCPLDAPPREIVDERVSQLYGPVPFTCPADIAQVNIVEDFLVFKPAHGIAHITIVEAFPGYMSAHSEARSAPFAVPLIAPVLIVLALVELAQFYLLVGYRAVVAFARRLVARLGVHVLATETIMVYDTSVAPYIFETPEPLRLVEADLTALNAFWGEFTMDGVEVVVAPADVFVEVEESTVLEVEEVTVPYGVAPGHDQDFTFGDVDMILSGACLVALAFASRGSRRKAKKFLRQVGPALQGLVEPVGSQKEAVINCVLSNVEAIEAKPAPAPAPILVTAEPSAIKVEEEVIEPAVATSPVPIHASGVHAPHVKGTVSEISDCIVREDTEPIVDINPPVLTAFWGELTCNGVNVLVGPSPEIFVELAVPADDGLVAGKVEDYLLELTEQVTQEEPTLGPEPEKPIASTSTVRPSTAPTRPLRKPVTKVAGRRVVLRPKTKSTA